MMGAIALFSECVRMLHSTAAKKIYEQLVNRSVEPQQARESITYARPVRLHGNNDDVNWPYGRRPLNLRGVDSVIQTHTRTACYVLDELRDKRSTACTK